MSHVFICNGCHVVSMMTYESIAILNAKGVDHRCVI